MYKLIDKIKDKIKIYSIYRKNLKTVIFIIENKYSLKLNNNS